MMLKHIECGASCKGGISSNELNATIILNNLTTPSNTDPEIKKTKKKYLSRKMHYNS